MIENESSREAWLKFFEQAQFKQLNSQWRKKLAKSGFSDIESDQETLKDHNRRSQLFDDRDSVLEFFLALDEYLNEAKIPRKHKRTLELYSSGIHLKEISVKVNMSYAWVRLIVNKYERIILEKY